jgi:hypothetical protein
MSLESIGYYYEVTDEQIIEHQKKSIMEIFQWHHDMNVFLNAVRTSEEKEIAKKMKSKNYFTERHSPLLATKNEK